MKNILILSFTLLFGFHSSVVQSQIHRSPFEMVNVPESIRWKLAQFLEKKEKLDTPSMAIYIYNLLEPKNYVFKDGIYQFRLMGPHFIPRIFIFNHGKMKIFQNYDLESFLGEYLSYIKISSLSPRTEIKYLTAIAQYFQEEYYRENN